MIIFGTKGVTLSGESGQFYCPSCASSQPYTHKTVRRFFTLFFIPIIPLDKLGNYVECHNCNGTFKEDALNYNPQKEQAEFNTGYHKAIRHIMIAMMAIDGDVDQGEVETIRDVYLELTGKAVLESQIRDEVSEASSQRPQLIEYLQHIAPQLNEHGKEKVVRAAYAVALADHEIVAAERGFMDEIARAINISNAHYRGILAEMDELNPAVNPTASTAN